MEKTRRLFCEMGPWAYWLSMKKCRFVRRVQDMFSGVRFSRHRRCEPLPVVVYAHKSLIRRTLGTVDQKLQENKAVNLSLAATQSKRSAHSSGRNIFVLADGGAVYCAPGIFTGPDNQQRRNSLRRGRRDVPVYESASLDGAAYAARHHGTPPS